MSTPAQKLQSERYTYPGLLPREIIIIRQWLKQHQQEYARWIYNLRIGKGSDPGPTFTDAVRRSAILNSMPRVDAVGLNGNDQWRAAFDAWYAKPAEVVPIVEGNTATLGAVSSVWLAPVPAGYTDAVIMEVKDRAGPPAFGQLIMYSELWKQANYTDPAPRLLIVTNRTPANILGPAAALHISIDVVEASFDELKRGT